MSGILAFFIITLLCRLYYHLPQHIVDIEGATDYKNEANFFGLQGREGFGYYYANNDGYNNAFPYEKDMLIHILLIGSSNMQAEEIPYRKNTSSLLADLTGRIVYNIGMGGHGFTNCSVNFEAAVKKYKPSEYAIIETSKINFSDEELKQILTQKIRKRPAYDKGILSMLRQSDFLRLLYHQFPRLMKSRMVRMANNPPAENPSNSDNIKLLNEVLNMLSNIASHNKVKLIIAYHPSASLNKDGTLKINCDSELVRQFSDLCTQNGIYFLDMSGRFLDEYEKNYTLPYGFLNTSVCKGHMNQYGHRMFAEEIYKLIDRIEAGL